MQFNIEENIIIKCDQDEKPKKIKIFNNKEKPIPFKPIDLQKYIKKLKTKKKLKSLLLKKPKENSFKNINQKSIDEKLALDKLSQLINECGESNESDEESEEEFNNIISKNNINKTRNQIDKTLNIENKNLNISK